MIQVYIAVSATSTDVTAVMLTFAVPGTFTDFTAVMLAL